MNWQQIIDTFYPEDGALRSILITHSERVAAKAQAIIDRRPDLDVDSDFVQAAAMLHDIGIIRCDADGIHCHGKEHYLLHGLIGGQMLRSYAEQHDIPATVIEPYARVCERHTGAGLTKEDIIRQHLPMTPVDLLPETTAEKLICYADKFFSKTRPEQEKTLDSVIASMRKFGNATEQRFLELHNTFK